MLVKLKIVVYFKVHKYFIKIVPFTGSCQNIGKIQDKYYVISLSQKENDYVSECIFIIQMSALWISVNIHLIEAGVTGGVNRKILGRISLKFFKDS